MASMDALNIVCGPVYDLEQFTTSTGAVSFVNEGGALGVCLEADTVSNVVSYADLKGATYTDPAARGMNTSVICLTMDLLLKSAGPSSLNQVEGLFRIIDTDGALAVVGSITGQYGMLQFRFPTAAGGSEVIRVVSNRRLRVGVPVHLKILVEQQYNSNQYGRLFVEWDGAIVIDDHFVRTGAKSYDAVRFGSEHASSTGIKVRFGNISVASSINNQASRVMYWPVAGPLTLGGGWSGDVPQIQEIPPDGADGLQGGLAGSFYTCGMIDPLQIGFPAQSVIYGIKLMARVKRQAVSGSWAPNLSWFMSDPVNGAAWLENTEFVPGTSGWTWWEYATGKHPSAGVDWSLELLQQLSIGHVLQKDANDANSNTPVVLVDWLGAAIAYRPAAQL